jgi:hypothetical protein
MQLVSMPTWDEDDLTVVKTMLPMEVASKVPQLSKQPTESLASAS